MLHLKGEEPFVVVVLFTELCAFFTASTFTVGTGDDVAKSADRRRKHIPPSSSPRVSFYLKLHCLNQEALWQVRF
jgi:hypothetical protein